LVVFCGLAAAAAAADAGSIAAEDVTEVFYSSTAAMAAQGELLAG
jgi:hypothetical protein